MLAIDTLVGMGCEFRSQEANELARDGPNQVLLRDELIAAVQPNDVPRKPPRDLQ
ncbi:MAG: hypothetical protein H6509_15790 [Bryobacterales bacterium]|nr:hypothetical protein [Bryobacterales bacterium]